MMHRHSCKCKLQISSLYSSILKSNAAFLKVAQLLGFLDAAKFKVVARVRGCSFSKCNFINIFVVELSYVKATLSFCLVKLCTFAGDACLSFANVPTTRTKVNELLFYIYYFLLQLELQ